MAHTLRDQKKLTARVRRIRGQAEALEKSLAQGAECARVLQQIAAIRGAVTGLMTEVLDGHIREHLAGEGVTARQRAEAVEEVVSALRSYLR